MAIVAFMLGLVEGINEDKLEIEVGTLESTTGTVDGE